MTDPPKGGFVFTQLPLFETKWDENGSSEIFEYNGSGCLTTYTYTYESGKPRVIERYNGSGTEIPYRSTTYYESGYKASEFTYDAEGNVLTESHWEDGEQL